MSNIFGTNTTSDLMSVAETAQTIMQGKSLTESSDWLEAEMEKVQYKWPRTNPKIKKQWLKKITARAEKDGMDMSTGGEFEDRLDDYGLTVHADDKVWTEASKLKSKWKKMSTAERTRSIDKLDDLARKQNTSDEDVRAIIDEFGLHMSEEVEVAEAVLADRDYEYDGKVIKISKKNFSKVPNDYKNSTKGKERMITYDDKAGTVSVPVQFTEEVEIDEYKSGARPGSKKQGAVGSWVVIDTADRNKIQVFSTDEKGARDSIKYSTMSKHDYHYGKDPKTLKVVMLKKKHRPEYDMGTPLKEEVEVDESNELQAIMALDDVGIEASINKKDQVVVKKKDLKKAEAALKKSFRKGGAPELHAEEVEIEEKFNKKKFDDNEDKNDHTGNGVELVNMFGTTSEKKTMAQIQKNHDKNGEISRKDQSTRDAMVKKYYPKLEEVEIEEKIEKESYGSFITAAAKAKKEGKKTFMMGGKKYPVTIKQKISAAYEEAEVEEAKLYAAKGTAYPATIDTLKMIVREKQNQTVMFKSGKAIVDLFTASAMVQVYDALKKPEMKKTFEKMIGDKAGFLKTQAFAMKMISGGK